MPTPNPNAQQPIRVAKILVTVAASITMSLRKEAQGFDTATQSVEHLHSENKEQRETQSERISHSLFPES